MLLHETPHPFTRAMGNVPHTCTCVHVCVCFVLKQINMSTINVTRRSGCREAALNSSVRLPSYVTLLINCVCVDKSAHTSVELCSALCYIRKPEKFPSYEGWEP
ncbi:hypothetical protein AMECASPLE_012885 [Ameca splendens]|uniref:Uncharacterized protein n=1 Tax=Ameca splendens TaxID=208324 RepID=A0ABV0ZZA7_9TELE